MQGIIDTFTGIWDQLNPYSTGNIVLYFSWLVVYTLTWVAIWRSERPWFRCLCFVVNQLFSVGMLQATVVTGILAYSFWQESLGAFVATGACSLYVFRRRKPRAVIADEPRQTVRFD